MRLLIFITLFSSFALSVEGQTVSTLTDEIVSLLSKRDKFYEKYRTEDGYYDSLYGVSIALSNYLKQTLPQNPTALNGPFAPIRHLLVASSPDGKMRIWTWDTKTGGSMPSVQNVVAYQTGQGIKVVDLEEDLGWGPKERGGNNWFDTIFAVVQGNRTIYLPRAPWKADGRHSGLYLHAFAIDADTLNTELALFPAPSYSDKLWDVELNASCEDCEVPKSKLVGDTVYIQHIGANKRGREVLTSKWDVYKFDGKHFVHKGIQK